MFRGNSYLLLVYFPYQSQAYTWCTPEESSRPKHPFSQDAFLFNSTLKTFMTFPSMDQRCQKSIQTRHYE